TVGLSCADAFAADQTPLGEQLIEAVGAISAPSPVAGSYIVAFKTGTSDAEQSSAVAGAGAKDISAISQLRIHVVDASEAQVSELMASSAVERVEADRVRGVQAAPGDPAYSSQWSLPRVGWDQAFGAIHPTGSAVAAILDTGV